LNKLKVTAVSYLNTKPLLYGIFKSSLAGKIDLQLDIPSVCASKLKSGEADLGLVPVAVIPELATPHLISDYCIGTVGPVKTVAVYGDRPIGEMTHIYLDYHSRTSVELTRILLEEYWKATPELIPAHSGYEQEIRESRGGLVIGDRTIGMEEKHPYVYDLGEAWMAHTGLPFVFAAWVSNRPLDEEFLAQFNQALKQGVEEIPQLIYLIPAPAAGFDLKEYFTKYISYEFDEAKRKALSVFLEKVNRNLRPSQEKAPAVPVRGL
jgi:chorismate dehydratase